MRAGEAPFVAIPFHGRTMANVAHDGARLFWDEVQGSLFVKRFAD